MEQLREIQLEPFTKKGKRLIKEHGREWLIVERSISLPCFDGASGMRIKPVSNTEYTRWIRDDGSPDFIIQH